MQKRLCDSFRYSGVSLWQEDGDRRLRGIDQWPWEDAEDQRTGDHQDERCGKPRRGR